MKRLAVLISGRGTNLQAVVDAIEAGDLDAQIVVVVSNRRDAHGLVRAERAAIPTAVLAPDGYATRAAFDADLAALVEPYAPDLVVLAGWMLILGTGFLDRFPDRVINLHPALAGRFPGTEAIERAYQAFQRGDIDHTGVMVHHVIPEVDAGPIIVEEVVPIRGHDTLADLTARIHQVEHRLIIEAIRSPDHVDLSPR